MSAPATFYTSEDLDPSTVSTIRKALTDLGGEGSLEALGERTGNPPGLVEAALLERAPTEFDGELMPFALPSRYGRDKEGRQVWRVEARWTPSDMDEGAERLRARGRELHRIAQGLLNAARERGHEQDRETLGKMGELRLLAGDG